MDAKIDRRVGTLAEEELVRNVDVEKALELMCRLDGVQHTLLCLISDADRMMLIGGGADRFIVNRLDCGGASYTLIDVGGNISEAIEICAGGQFAEYPSNMAVGRKLVSDAIMWFFGDLANVKSLNWAPD